MESKLREEIKELLQNGEGLCVSIYMPTHRAGLETQQDPIRLKNLLGRAQDQVIATGMRTPEVAELFRPARELLEDGFFWRSQGEGLAMFIGQGLLRVYRVPIRFEEMAVVNNHFIIHPLFPLLNGEGRFYVLALSQKHVRLLRCSQFNCEEVELEGVVKSMDEAMQYDDPAQRVRFHTRVKGTMGSKGESIFRGHGTGVDDTKTDILRYLLKVDEGLHAYLREEQAPLVVAGVDYILPLYREANTYQHLFSQGITGNPDGLSADELHREAWKLLEPYFERTIEEAIEKYLAVQGTGLASDDIRAILSAAYSGRVAALFLPTGRQHWGRFDPQTHEVELHEEASEDDEDLLNFAAILTFMNSGDVYTLEPERIPGGGELAASFRY